MNSAADPADHATYMSKFGETARLRKIDGAGGGEAIGRGTLNAKMIMAGGGSGLGKRKLGPEIARPYLNKAGECSWKIAPDLAAAALAACLRGSTLECWMGATISLFSFYLDDLALT